MLAKCAEELEELKQADIEKGVRFTDEQFAVLKYETNDVKTLKNLTVSKVTILHFLYKWLTMISIMTWISLDDF